MNIPSFNELRKISSSRYGLVMLVSKRSRKIVDGNDPLIKTKHEKPVSIAIEEIIDGAVKFGEPMSDKEYSQKIEAQREAKLNSLKNNDESDVEVSNEIETTGEGLIESQE